MALTEEQRTLTNDLFKRSLSTSYHPPEITSEAKARGAKRKRIEEIAESRQQADDTRDGWN